MRKESSRQKDKTAMIKGLKYSGYMALGLIALLGYIFATGWIGRLLLSSYIGIELAVIIGIMFGSILALGFAVALAEEEQNGRMESDQR